MIVVLPLLTQQTTAVRNSQLAIENIASYITIDLLAVLMITLWRTVEEIYRNDLVRKFRNCESEAALWKPIANLLNIIHHSRLDTSFLIVDINPIIFEGAHRCFIHHSHSLHYFHKSLRWISRASQLFFLTKKNVLSERTSKLTLISIAADILNSSCCLSTCSMTLSVSLTHTILLPNMTPSSTTIYTPRENGSYFPDRSRIFVAIFSTQDVSETHSNILGMSSLRELIFTWNSGTSFFLSACRRSLVFTT